MTQIFENPAILWFAAGLVLFLAELILPGLILAFFAVGAWLTAVAYLLFHFGFNAQLVVFMVSSIMSLALLRRYLLNNTNLFSLSGVQENELTREFVGHTCTVSETITPGPAGGRVLFRGTNWKAHANKAVPAGESVRIVSKDSIVLFVEPVN
jgi:membrane protein implicated in regulation of membrane protease activity